MKIILLIYLIVVAIVDIYKKEIPFRFSFAYLTFFVGLQLLFYQSGVISIVGGIAIGIVLLGISMITRGAIGLGDGIMFVVIGSAIGFSDTLTLLTGSLMIASLVAMFLLIFRRVGKEYCFPFAPFVCFAYGGMMIFG